MKPCLVLSHALHCRNWLASGMLDKMTRAGLYGTVLMPAALVVEYSKQVPFGWDLKTLEPWMARGRETRALEALRLGMLVAGARRGGLNYLMKVQAKRRPLATAEVLAWRILSQATDPLPIVRGLGRALPAPRTPFPAGCTHLILPTMIHDDAQQAGIVRAARRAGAPVWVIPAGFDNLVTKGAFLDQPERIATWGADMATHAVEQHGFAPGQVTITGPPHFWPYNKTARVSRLVMPHNRHVVFAGTTVNYAADELLIIRTLGDALAANSKTRDIAILYRPHPRRIISGPQMDMLKGHHIVMDPRWAGGWSGRPEEISWIRSITEGALCTISAFSTVVLESALVGTPSILIGFGDSAHGTGQALDHARYEHMAAIVGKPGIWGAATMNDLVGLVRAAAGPQKMPPGVLRTWALQIAAVDADPRDRLIDWMKEPA
jgi:hypothetical protein